MQNHYFDSALGAQLRPLQFRAGSPVGDMRPEPDDFCPQLHLTLHGPNNLAVATVLRFEAEAETFGSALRLLARPGLAAGTAVHALPLAQLTAPTTVALSVAGLAPGRYALWTDALSNLSATAVWLVDAHAGVRVNLRQAPVYVFTAVAAAPGRFWLHLLPLAPADRSTSPEGMRGLAGSAWGQA